MSKLIELAIKNYIPKSLQQNLDEVVAEAQRQLLEQLKPQQAIR